MRDQYAGDVSDVLKFAFLRALADEDRRLGIAWYYAPGDHGRGDGRHLEWRDEPAWQRLDPQLHVGLSTLPERSIAALKRAAIWPKGVLFHCEPVPARVQRDAWAGRMRAALNDADIAFLDPDNGLGKKDKKHATESEVQLLWRPGRAIVFITFPGRTAPHDMQVKRLHEQLSVIAGGAAVVTLRTNVSVARAQGAGSNVQLSRWLTIVDPDATLLARARKFADSLTTIPRVRARLDDRG